MRENKFMKLITVVLRKVSYIFFKFHVTPYQNKSERSYHVLSFLS